MSSPGDLVSLATAQSYLAQSLPTDQAALPFAITAASNLIRQFTRRDFVQQNYNECYNGQGYSEVFTRQWPVNYISRISINPMNVLTVANLDGTTNQRGTARLNTTGDAYAGLVVTGLYLLRVASAVTHTDTSILFATYPTINAAAAAVTALGNGWQGTAVEGYELWPTSDLRAIQGAQNAMQPGGATFNVFINDVSGYQVNELTGGIRFQAASYDPVFALMNWPMANLQTTFPPGYQSINIQYNAGYATVPEDVQQACLITVQHLLYALQTVTKYESETIKDYSYKLGPLLLLPESVKSMLRGAGRVSYRNY
jgi:hypothetical protein